MNKLLFPQDVVGGSFWLISIAMIGAAIFFFLERGRLSKRWNTVMTLVGVIALMSSIHYFYAKNLWVLNGQAPIAIRYIDWTLTFPLQILTFYVMLSTVTEVKRGMFWRLLVFRCFRIHERHTWFLSWHSWLALYHWGTVYGRRRKKKCCLWK